MYLIPLVYILYCNHIIYMQVIFAIDFIYQTASPVTYFFIYLNGIENNLQ